MDTPGVADQQSLKPGGTAEPTAPSRGFARWNLLLSTKLVAFVFQHDGSRNKKSLQSHSSQNGLSTSVSMSYIESTPLIENIAARRLKTPLHAYCAYCGVDL